MIQLKRAADFAGKWKALKVARMVEQMKPYSLIQKETGARRELINKVIAQMWGPETVYPGRKYGGGDMTLCWFCDKAVGGCSWSRSFEPVEGWEARETRIKLSKDPATGEQMYDTSFFVMACPEYVVDRYIKTEDLTNADQ